MNLTKILVESGLAEVHDKELRVDERFLNLLDTEISEYLAQTLGEDGLNKVMSLSSDEEQIAWVKQQVPTLQTDLQQIVSQLSNDLNSQVDDIFNSLDK
jgi:hypothetical protein